MQALYLVEICLALHAAGAFFSIENPVPSHLWICACFQKLKRMLDNHLYIVTFDQCAFKLTLPGASPFEFCRKTKGYGPICQSYLGSSADAPAVVISINTCMQ